jgi:hypothetical protein
MNSQCFQRKDLNPYSCKFLVKCKDGFERDDNFKCVKINKKTIKIPSTQLPKNITIKKRKETKHKMNEILGEIYDKIVSNSSKPGLILRSIKALKNKLLNSNDLNDKYRNLVSLFKTKYNINNTSIDLEPKGSINKINEILASPPVEKEPFILFTPNSSPYKLPKMTKKQKNALFQNKPNEPPEIFKSKYHKSLRELTNDIFSKYTNRPSDYYKRLIKLKEKGKNKLTENEVKNVENLFFTKYQYKPIKQKKTRKPKKTEKQQINENINNYI